MVGVATFDQTTTKPVTSTKTKTTNKKPAFVVWLSFDQNVKFCYQTTNAAIL